MNAVLHLSNLQSANIVITVGEFLTWLGLFFAATLKQESGRDLWFNKRSKRVVSHFSTPEGPNFDRFMGRHRFEDIKLMVLEAFNDHSVSGHTDPWCFIRPLITAFNDNRKRSVVDTDFVVVDESMSAFRPRTTKSGACDCHKGGLPHLSFVERKPGKHHQNTRTLALTLTFIEPLGTELKNVGL